MITPENQCQGKKQYKTAEETQKAIAHTNKSGRKVSVYHCNICGNYHIGHNCKGRKLRSVKDTPIIYVHESHTHIAQRRFIK